MLSLFRKKISNDLVISKDFLRSLNEVHDKINRNINLVINQRGKIDLIYLGEIWQLEDFTKLKFGDKNISNIKRLVSISSRKNEFEKKEKVSLINSKFINFLLVRRKAGSNLFSLCYKSPELVNNNYWKVDNFNDINKVNEDTFLNISSRRKNKKKPLLKNKFAERIYLVGVTVDNKKDLDASINELKELSYSLEKEVVGVRTQVRKSFDAKTLMGKGLFEDVLLEAEYLNADKIVFNKELLPFQAKEISKLTYMNVSDRTELILDIFAKNAQSKEAHTQIELARLKYELPRLAGTGAKFSQIAGGIRAKGPGEKKIEQRRRYLRKRINVLEKQINALAYRRTRTRSKRERNELFTVTLIGYTCAGKSTLFNKLTKSNVLESTKPFSTLNPTTRKTYLSDKTEILLSDTVGFITDLPEDLISSFRATLEEINQSDLLIHIVDCSEDDFEEKILSVEDTLIRTGLIEHERLIIFNKIDLISDDKISYLKTKYQQPCVSSLKSQGLQEARGEIEKVIQSLNEKNKVANL